MLGCKASDIASESQNNMMLTHSCFVCSNMASVNSASI